MEHTKTIKDERGTINIYVKLWIDQWKKAHRYDVRVGHIAPRKRTEYFNDDVATPEEIQAAKMEFWNLIKP